MVNKKFTDFERSYIKEIKTETLSKLIDEYRSSGEPTPFDYEDSFTELLDAVIQVERDFIKKMIKQDTFLTLPILAATYDENEDEYILAVEEMENGYYRTLRFSGGMFSVSTTLLAAYPNTDCQWKTIKDFLNDPPEDADISEYI